MAPCYVVFEGKKPGIYFSWHECAKYVLTEKGAIYEKYNSYDEALRAFNDRVPGPPMLLPSGDTSHDPTASQMLLANERCATNPHSDGKQGWWKNVVILILLLVVACLCYMLFMCHK
jgi:hypothetical protein